MAISSIQQKHYTAPPQLVFRRHAHQRTIDFATIAEAAQVDLTEVSFLLLCLIFNFSLSIQVELLVMKALSLGLVRGIQ